MKESAEDGLLSVGGRGEGTEVMVVAQGEGAERALIDVVTRWENETWRMIEWGSPSAE